MAFLINPDKPKISLLDRLLRFFWPYITITILVICLIYYAWFKLAKDDTIKESVNTPEFEPPDVLPWQAQYLITEGGADFKNTFLSYVLWLSYKKYIQLIPGKDKEGLRVKLLQDLPKFRMPEIFNTVIEDMQNKNAEEAFKDLQFYPAGYIEKLSSFIKDTARNFYTQLPFNKSSIVIYTILVYIAIGTVSKLVWNAIRSIFLIGYSYEYMWFYFLILSLPGVTFVVLKWGKLNTLGLSKKAYCLRYKYYLEKAEKLKLDFSNNPRDGVQYYLSSVPFATSFGVLPQFSKYMQKLLPDQTEVSTINNFTTYLAYSSFYVPPSSSDGGFSGGGGSW